MAVPVFAAPGDVITDYERCSGGSAVGWAF